MDIHVRALTDSKMTIKMQDAILLSGMQNKGIAIFAFNWNHYLKKATVPYQKKVLGHPYF